MYGQIEIFIIGSANPSVICLSEVYIIGGMGRDEGERRVIRMGCIFKRESLIP